MTCLGVDIFCRHCFVDIWMVDEVSHKMSESQTTDIKSLLQKTLNSYIQSRQTPTGVIKMFPKHQDILYTEISCKV